MCPTLRAKELLYAEWLRRVGPGQADRHKFAQRQPVVTDHDHDRVIVIVERHNQGDGSTVGGRAQRRQSGRVFVQHVEPGCRSKRLAIFVVVAASQVSHRAIALIDHGVLGIRHAGQQTFQSRVVVIHANQAIRLRLHDENHGRADRCTVQSAHCDVVAGHRDL